jgi:hypothetical protein
MRREAGKDECGKGEKPTTTGDSVDDAGGKADECEDEEVESVQFTDRVNGLSGDSNIQAAVKRLLRILLDNKTEAPFTKKGSFYLL